MAVRLRIPPNPEVADEEEEPSIWDIDEDAVADSLRRSSRLSPNRKARAVSPMSPTAHRSAEDKFQMLTGGTLASSTASLDADARSPSPLAGRSKFTRTGLSSTTKSRAAKARLQTELKTYIQKTDATKLELANLNDDIKSLRRRVQSLEATRGGFQAVQENEKAVQRTQAIMQKRLAKALDAFMGTVAANSRVKEAINKDRRDKNNLLVASASYRKDCDKLVAESAHLEEAIQRQQLKLEEVNNEKEAVVAESEMKQDELEARWRYYADMDMEVKALPSMTLEDGEGKGGPDAAGTAASEVAPGSRAGTPAPPGVRTNWDFGFESSAIISKFAKVENAKEVFHQVSQLTGSPTIEDFVERWQDAQDKNFTLYGRVAALVKEAEDLRTEITELRVKAKGSFKKQVKENTVRKTVLEQVKDKLAATEVKMEKLKQQSAAESDSLDAVKRGLRSLLETMDGEETEELAGANIMDYFGIVEQSVQEALVWYYRNVVRMTQAAVEPSPDKWDDDGMQRRLTPRMLAEERSRKLGDMKRHSSSKSLEHDGVLAPAALVKESTVSVGPPMSTGNLTRRIVSSVSVPSIDGPRDAKLSLAFTVPFSTGPLSPRGDSDSDDGRRAYTRPLLVPSGATRNSVRVPTSPVADLSMTYPPPAGTVSGVELPAVGRPPSAPERAASPLAPARSSSTEEALPAIVGSTAGGRLATPPSRQV